MKENVIVDGVKPSPRLYSKFRSNWWIQVFFGHGSIILFSWGEEMSLFQAMWIFENTPCFCLCKKFSICGFEEKPFKDLYQINQKNFFRGFFLFFVFVSWSIEELLFFNLSFFESILFVSFFPKVFFLYFCQFSFC